MKTTDWVGEKNPIFEYGTQVSGTPATSFGLDLGTNFVAGMSTNHATLDPFTNGGFNDDSTKYLGITSTMDQWVHMAMVWNGTDLRTYVNGVLGITTIATSTTMLATGRSTLVIGCNDFILTCFNGYLDEFRVWKVARTATDIANNYKTTLTGSEKDLSAYWKFDDAADSTMAADAVTTTGHVAHPGLLMAAAPAQNPTFIVPTPAVPLSCP